MLNVLCLNWNGHHLLKDMIPSLKNNLNKCGINSKIYVRDNGSKDESVSYLKEESDVVIYEVGHNRDSFSQGVNSLFKLADINFDNNDDDLILLLNNDIKFNDDLSLLKMINLMKATKAAIVGARLMYEDGVKISHNGVIFSSRYNSMPWHFREGEALSKNDYKNKYFQAVTAACCLVKPENFRKAGMLDENLKWAFEDISLNLDVLINQKQKIACCGETNIIHLTSNSLKKNPMNKLFMQQNVSYFKNKWSGKYKIDHEHYLNNADYNDV